MQQFQVPQFIEREARVVGPLTFKQFLFLAAAGIAALLLYFFLPFALFVAGTVLVGGAGIALAFLSMGGRSLPSFLMGFLVFSMKTKTYAWKKGRVSQVIKQNVPAALPKGVRAERLSLSKESRVKNLSDKLDRG